MSDKENKNSRGLKINTTDYLGPYAYEHHKEGFRLADHTAKFFEFILFNLKSDGPLLDIGTGSGALPLLTAAKTTVNFIVGVESMREESALFKKNINANNLAPRVICINDDYRALVKTFKRGTFSTIVSNPPYLKKSSGKLSTQIKIARFKEKLFGTMTDLINVSNFLLHKEGQMFFMYPEEKFIELTRVIEEKGLKLSTVDKIDNIVMAEVTN